MKRKSKENIFMPFIAAPVIIPETIRTVFSKFARSRTFSARQVQRAKIILLAADGLNNMHPFILAIKNRAACCPAPVQALPEGVSGQPV